MAVEEFQILLVMKNSQVQTVFEINLIILFIHIFTRLN